MIDKRAEIVTYLMNHHTGREKAIQSKDLELVFDVKSRDLRRMIGKLREERFAVCSCERGYFYASTKKEITKTARRLRTLANRISASKKGLMKSELPIKSPQKGVAYAK